MHPFILSILLLPPCLVGNIVPLSVSHYMAVVSLHHDQFLIRSLWMEYSIDWENIKLLIDRIIIAATEEE